MAISTKNKARLIQSVALVELVADELGQRVVGGSVAKLIRRVIGTMPAELAGDVPPENRAVVLVKSALSKTSPSVVAAAIAKRTDQCKQIVQDAGLPGDLQARAMQLLGQAGALAAKVSSEVDRAPKRAPAEAETKKPRERSTELQTADTSPAAAKGGGWMSRMVQAAKDNPIPAAGLILGTLFALRRK